MPTIGELIAQTEAERQAAERRRSDADAAMQRILRAAETDGRDRLTVEEDGRVDRLTKERREAGDEAKRLTGQLDAYRTIADEEAEVSRLARKTYRPAPAAPTATRPSGSAPPSGPTSHRRRPVTAAAWTAPTSFGTYTTIRSATTRGLASGSPATAARSPPTTRAGPSA